MTERSLKDRKCVPCEGGVPKLDAERVQTMLKELSGWRVENDRLLKSFTFKDFVCAMGFLNRIAIAAETEGHHPDFCVHYNKVDFTVWTHAVGGLSENDFILAAKIDDLCD